MILPPRGLKLGMIFKGAARACKLSSLLNKAERKRGKPKKKKKNHSSLQKLVLFLQIRKLHTWKLVSILELSSVNA